MRRTALHLAVLLTMILAMTAAGAWPGAAQAGAPQTNTERRIATLHRTLHITDAQEPLWRPMADSMRRGVAELDRVYAARAKAYGSMNAVDDLKSYGEVQETHASNVRSLIEPFTKLYDSFGPVQKKQADETFRQFTETAAKSAH